MSMITVVTGAAGALGSEVVRVLLERGHHVAALDLPSPRLDAEARPGACVPIGLDLTSGSAFSDATARIEKELGPVTGAVLCAGGWAGGEDEFRSVDASAGVAVDQDGVGLLAGFGIDEDHAAFARRETGVAPGGEGDDDGA